ncbi:MAG: hypothetical protein AB7H96_24705 [Vicinamibacterales bacterium]
MGATVMEFQRQAQTRSTVEQSSYRPLPLWFHELLECVGDVDRRALLAAGFECGLDGALERLLALGAAPGRSLDARALLAAGYDLGSSWMAGR